MAIKAKNFVNMSEQKVVKSSAEAPKAQVKVRNKKQIVETPKEVNLKAKYRIEKKETKGVASTETALLVNGKQRSIGRKSHYLLDMLTLDDE